MEYDQKEKKKQGGNLIESKTLHCNFCGLKSALGSISSLEITGYCQRGDGKYEAGEMAQNYKSSFTCQLKMFLFFVEKAFNCQSIMKHVTYTLTVDFDKIYRIRF